MGRGSLHLVTTPLLSPLIKSIPPIPPRILNTGSPLSPISEAGGSVTECLCLAVGLPIAGEEEEGEEWSVQDGGRHKRNKTAATDEALL